MLQKLKEKIYCAEMLRIYNYKGKAYLKSDKKKCREAEDLMSTMHNLL